MVGALEGAPSTKCSINSGFEQDKSYPVFCLLGRCASHSHPAHAVRIVPKTPPVQQCVHSRCISICARARTCPIIPPTFLANAHAFLYHGTSVQESSDEDEVASNHLIIESSPHPESVSRQDCHAGRLPASVCYGSCGIHAIPEPIPPVTVRCIVLCPSHAP